jgi:hypothetical protein
LQLESPCVDAGTAYVEFNGEIIYDLSPEEYEGFAPDIGPWETSQMFVPDPIITGIIDVPDDQGGRVYIDFQRSFHDKDGLTNRVEVYTVERFDVDQWVGVLTQSAYNDSSYRVEVTTLADSSSTSDGISEYRVIANMEEGNFVSETATGYSVDNIAPSVPEGLSALVSAEGIILNWIPNSEEDFQYYGIYRSTESDFEPDSMDTYTYATSDTSFIDSDVEVGAAYYYSISAFDYSGNESKFSTQVGNVYLAIDDALLIPSHFTLHSNHPNPFNPITTLRYDLPSDALVTLSIYDMLGREITQLVNTTQQAGFKSVQWDATASMGRPVSAGVYLYRIQAGEFVQTKKMVLLK